MARLSRPRVARRSRSTSRSVRSRSAPTTSRARSTSVSRKKKTPTSRRNGPDIVTLFVQDVSSVVQNLVTEPSMLVFAAIFLAIVVTHDFDTLQGYFFTICDPHTNALCQKLQDNARKLPGLLLTIGTYFAINNSKAITICGAAVVAVAILPPLPVLLYGLFLATLIVFTKVNRKSSKLLLILIAALTFWVYDGLTIIKNVSNSPTYPYDTTYTPSTPPSRPASSTSPP